MTQTTTTTDAITDAELVHFETFCFVANGFAVTTSEVANALFFGDKAKALDALNETPHIAAEYWDENDGVSGSERRNDGRYRELLWQCWGDLQGSTDNELREEYKKVRTC